MLTYAHDYKAVISDPYAEAAAIVAAKNGDNAAKEVLLNAYEGLVAATVARFANSANAEDLAQEGRIGLLMAIDAHDPRRSLRLAATAPTFVLEAVRKASDAETGHAVIPSRTLQRYYSILARFDGDESQAALNAPSFDMSTSTFNSISRLLEAGESDPDAVAAGLAEYAAVEDRALATQALSAVAWDDARILRIAYGFEESRFSTPGAGIFPALRSDGEVAEVTLQSRVTVYRRRIAALAKAREALGLEA